MPIEFTIKKEEGYFICTSTGAITNAELLQAYERLFNDQDFEPELHELVDLRKVEMGTITAETIRSLAALRTKYWEGKGGPVKVAIIAPEDLTFGFARMYQALSAESAELLQVFRDTDEALKWFGIDGHTL